MFILSLFNQEILPFIIFMAGCEFHNRVNAVSQFLAFTLLLLFRIIYTNS